MPVPPETGPRGRVLWIVFAIFLAILAVFFIGEVIGHSSKMANEQAAGHAVG